MSERYWHFVRCDGFGTPYLTHRDERVVRVGETLKVEGEIGLCVFGLHASRGPASALRYCGYSSRLCLVELGGTVIESEDSDKLVASERTVVAMLSLKETNLLLREFAAWCAMQVAHLWGMPGVVRYYLTEGDASRRMEAMVACRMPVLDVSGDAARMAAFSACTDQSWEAAKGAARDAAWAMSLRSDGIEEKNALWDLAREAQNAWLARRALEMMGVAA